MDRKRTVTTVCGRDLRAIIAPLVSNKPRRTRRTVALAVSSTWLTRVETFRQSFNLQDKDWQKTEQLKKDISSHLAQNPGIGFSRPLFDRVVTWKLERQENRAKRYRQNVTDDLVHKITSCAFSLVHSDRDTLARVRLEVLGALPGIEIGVASAILALTFPYEYGVIDPRVWKVIYGEDKSGFSLPDYTMYLGHLLDGASQLRWSAQELDFFTWRL
jgi:hypothetical protein